MNQGIYIALSGAKLQELRLEILSNNLANANTSGYKADKVSSRTFNFELDNALYDEETIVSMPDVKYPLKGIGSMSDIDYPLDHYQGTYTKTKLVGTDFSQGNFKHTGNPLNIALEGPGFIAVETPWGDRYTRMGDFNLNSEGELVTSDGYKVRGKGLSGLGEGILTIDETGNVLVDNDKQGNIDIVEFENQHLLKKEGHNFFVPKVEGNFEKKPENTTVKQEYIELPNINVVSEMVNLIELNRMYEAYQKTINSIDESTSKIIHEVGGR